LERLKSSLSKFQMSATPLGANEAEYWGHGWKWKTFIRAAKKSTADVVMHCDAYDCLCLESLDSMLSKFATLAAPIVFSYEPQAQPEYWLGLNSGLVIAERESLLKVFHDRCLEEMFPDHFNDQFQIQAMYSWNPDVFLLDKQGVLFHTLGPRSAKLAVQNNRLTNPSTGKAPAFVHAPNGQDLSEVERMIAGLNP
jgi:hypothetical protein